MTMHSDQHYVDAQTVGKLVEAQFPEWRELPITEQCSGGTVNAIFRIGDDLAARFPLIGHDPTQVRASLAAEAHAARDLAEAATVPTPEPVAIGEPGALFPLPWSVQTWLPGHDAIAEDPAGSNAFAYDLAKLIAALRVADTRGRRFAGSTRTSVASSESNSDAARSSGGVAWLGRSSRRWDWSGTTSIPTRR